MVRLVLYNYFVNQRAISNTSPVLSVKTFCGLEIALSLLGGFMADVQWIKITTNIFDDEKIRLLETLPDGDAILVIWLKLLTMAGKCNDCGMIYLTRDIPYNDEMLSTLMKRPINTIRLALQEFVNLGMISIIDGFIELINWNKYQNIEGLEKIKEQNRIRQAKHRQKQIENNVTSRDSNGIEKKREEKNRLDQIRIDKNRKEKKAPFKKPSIQEISEFLKELNSSEDAERIYYFYESKGWMVGKNKMKDWKASVRGWVKRSKPEEKKLSIDERLDKYEKLKKKIEAEK